MEVELIIQVHLKQQFKLMMLCLVFLEQVGILQIIFKVEVLELLLIKILVLVQMGHI